MFRMRSFVVMAMAIIVLLMLALPASSASEEWIIRSCYMQSNGSVFTVQLQPKDDDSTNKTNVFSDGFIQMLAIMKHFDATSPQDLVGKSIEGDPIDHFLGILRENKIVSLYEETLNTTAEGLSQVMYPNFADFYRDKDHIVVLERIYDSETYRSDGVMGTLWFKHLKDKVEKLSAGKVTILRPEPKTFNFQGLERYPSGDIKLQHAVCLTIVSSDGKHHDHIMMGSDPFWRAAETRESVARPHGYHYLGVY